MQLDSLFRQIAQEEAGKYMLLCRRRDPGTYEEYKEVVCRLQLLVELTIRFHKLESSDGLPGHNIPPITAEGQALRFLCGESTLEALEDSSRNNPFSLGQKKGASFGELMFFMRARANAR